MSPDQSIHATVPAQSLRLPSFGRRSALVALLGLLIAAYVGGCMVGREQERDQQLARQSACNADARCLRP